MWVIFFWIVSRKKCRWAKVVWYWPLRSATWLVWLLSCIVLILPKRMLRCSLRLTSSPFCKPCSYNILCLHKKVKISHMNPFHSFSWWRIIKIMFFFCLERCFRVIFPDPRSCRSFIIVEVVYRSGGLTEASMELIHMRTWGLVSAAWWIRLFSLE